MSALTILLLVGAVVFCTHMLEAVTGFGCTVLAFPLVLAVTGDIGFSKIVLSILAWLLALYIVSTQFRRINWRQFAVICLIASAGMPFGFLLFRSLDSLVLTRLLGGFIVLSAGLQLWRLYAGRYGEAGPLGYLYLFAGGVVHGVFATGGPLIVLYSARKLTGKSEFRATMCMLWATLNTLLMIRYWADGQFTPELGRDLLFLLPFLAAGILVGEFVHSRVDELLFKKIVFWTLGAVGLIMLFM